MHCHSTAKAVCKPLRAYDKSIVTAVFSDNRFYIVNNLRAVTLKIFIGCKYNVFSIFKRFCVREALHVFLPITTVLPIVFSLKNSISSDMRNSKFIPLPMPHFSQPPQLFSFCFIRKYQFLCIRKCSRPIDE